MKNGARAQLPDSAVFIYFFACVEKFVITLRLTTWNGKNLSTPGVFLPFNITLVSQTHTDTLSTLLLSLGKRVKRIILSVAVL